MALKLSVENYRGLRKVDCTFPDGVSIVVGPNGAGKTTLLKLPETFRHAYEQGWSKALNQNGGVHQYKYVGAKSDELVRLRLERGDLCWEVDFDGSIDQTISPSESVHIAGQRVVSRYDNADVFLAPDRKIAGVGMHASILRFVIDRGDLAPSTSDHVPNMRCYADLAAHELRTQGSEYSTDTRLRPSGINVLTVLRNWRDKRATQGHHDFVLDSLRESFPGFVGLDFEATSNVVDALVLTDGFDTSTKLRTSSNGFIHAMMCLTAIASAPDGGLVTIDEPETALHPYALKCVLAAMKEWSADHDIDVILSTHSPVVIDSMKGTPERVFVFSPEDGPGPTVLSDLKDREYLERFSIGDDYVASRLGAPAANSASARR